MSVRRMLLLVVVIAVAMASAVAPAQAATPWTLGPVVSPPMPAGILNAVDCPTTVVCVGVGRVFDPVGTVSTFSETSYNGRWTVRPAAEPTGVEVARLDAVSCAGPRDCTAVGFSKALTRIDVSVPLVERWNGTTWSLIPFPAPAAGSSAVLTGVSCVATGWCTAVGDVTDADGVHPLVATWDGAQWTLGTPAPTAGDRYHRGVSCTSTTFCVAVGYEAYESVIETWNGTQWSDAVAPAIGRLTAVSCTGPLACVAVGEPTGRGPYDSLVWNGSRWRTFTTQITDYRHRPRYTAISCAAPGDCTAVGDGLRGNQLTRRTTAVHWDGAAWSVVSTPNRPPVSDNRLLGVSCLPIRCTAVGVFGAQRGLPGGQPLAMSDTGGTWTLQAVPALAGARSSSLSAVSCPTSTTCIAVGRQLDVTDTATAAPMAQVWDGTTWTITPTPSDPSLFSSGLVGVSCVSPSTCVAVGSHGDGSNGARPGPVALRFDGAAWTPIPFPSTADGVYPASVSCVTATSCIAVGTGSAVWQWDGTAWTSVPLPAPPAASEDFRLTGVSCSGVGDCVGVGSYAVRRPQYATYPTTVVSTSGVWRAVMPSGGSAVDLQGVDCVSTVACTAVGGKRSVDTSDRQPLIETWDGAAWTVVSTPQVPRNRNLGLFGVDCRTATDCRAVGGQGVGIPLVLQPVRGVWRGVPSAVPAGTLTDGRLAGVSCAVGGPCVAVGSTYVSDGSPIYGQWQQRPVSEIGS